ncbi:MAG: hypothetical protein LQ346_006171 [Caloplaca aetnensis]|nr:MAG: hypothetical protein LQ346_006171 [Caloplaca aetnensis]
MASYDKPTTPPLPDIPVAPPSPRSLKLESATLSYQIRHEERWRVLRRAGREGTFNVGPVLFEADSISITQESNGNRCILKVDRAVFTVRYLTLAKHPARDPGNLIEFQCNTPAHCDFKSYTGDKGIAKAEEFPLAKISDQMYRVRLQLSATLGQWKILGGARAERPESLALVKWQLKQLCGVVSLEKPMGGKPGPKPKEVVMGASRPVRRPSVFTREPVITPASPEGPCRQALGGYDDKITPPPSPMPIPKPAEVPPRVGSGAYAGAATPHPLPVPTTPQPPSVRKRTRAQIDAEYDELEKEEEVLARLVRCRERKRQLEAERKNT